MGVVFLLLNPTVLLPETWHEMLKYSTESRIGHDSYEFMGHKLGDFPETEFCSDNGTHIGCHQDIEISQMDHVIVTVENFLKSKGY